MKTSLEHWACIVGIEIELKKKLSLCDDGLKELWNHRRSGW
jgi:hypothetical protein